MRRSRAALIVQALAIGTTILLLENLAVDLVTGQMPFADGTLGFMDAPDSALIHILVANLPLLILAVTGVRSTTLWRTAAGLTVLFAVYAVLQTWYDAHSGFAGGANIGLGLIMLASPIITLLIVALIAAIKRTRHLSQ